MTEIGVSTITLREDIEYGKVFIFCKFVKLVNNLLAWCKLDVAIYLEVIHQLFLNPSLYAVLRSCILLRLQAKGGYRTKDQDAGMDVEISGEWSYYPIPIVNIPSRLVSSTVDGADNNEEVAEIFAEKFESLYQSIPTDSTEMGSIKDEIKNLIINEDSVNECNVSFRDIDMAIKKLNKWKGDGSHGFLLLLFLHRSHYFIHK